MADNTAHTRGYAGEQSLGFFLGQQGYFFIDGPSGAKGHGITTRGFDGLAYNPKTGKLLIYDNKAYKRIGRVSRASAIEPGKNLSKNLTTMITIIEKMQSLPYRNNILQLLKETRNALATKKTWPVNVQIAVSNASGRSTGVSKGLQAKGIQFIDYYKAPRPKIGTQRRYLRGVAFIGHFLAEIAVWLGDIGIQRQIKKRLESDYLGSIQRAMIDGKGVLVIIALQEWSIPDGQGRRARSLLSVYIQSGHSKGEAMKKWHNTPHILQGAAPGWRAVTQYGWIPPQEP